MLFKLMIMKRNLTLNIGVREQRFLYFLDDTRLHTIHDFSSMIWSSKVNAFIPNIYVIL